MATAHKFDIGKASEEYLSGKSLPQVAQKHKASISTIRLEFKNMGILRSRSEGVQLAAKAGRLGSGMRGRKRTFSESHKSKISKAKKMWGERNAKGVSLKPNGYLEYTRGPHKGRSVHSVKMEERLGRPLKPDECVHHIDGIKTNNDDNNLALVTRAGHNRLHRFEEKLAGKIIERKKNGRFS